MDKLENAAHEVMTRYSITRTSDNILRLDSPLGDILRSAGELGCTHFWRGFTAQYDDILIIGGKRKMGEINTKIPGFRILHGRDLTVFWIGYWDRMQAGFRPFTVIL